MLPSSIEETSKTISKFPGVGKKSAQKLALDILEMNQEEFETFVQQTQNMRKNVSFCSVCGFFSENNNLCHICANHSRQENQICLVEKTTDVISVEKSNIYHGKYHILKNLISPLDNIFADDTTINQLVDRVKKISQKELELILFFKAGFSADATTAYLKEILAENNLLQKVKITRLAQGLPLYYNPDTLDQATMAKALEDRREVLL